MRNYKQLFKDHTLTPEQERVVTEEESLKKRRWLRNGYGLLGAGVGAYSGWAAMSALWFPPMTPAIAASYLAVLYGTSAYGSFTLGENVISKIRFRRLVKKITGKSLSELVNEDAESDREFFMNLSEYFKGWKFKRDGEKIVIEPQAA